MPIAKVERGDGGVVDHSGVYEDMYHEVVWHVCERLLQPLGV